MNQHRAIASSYPSATTFVCFEPSRGYLLSDAMVRVTSFTAYSPCRKLFHANLHRVINWALACPFSWIGPIP